MSRRSKLVKHSLASFVYFPLIAFLCYYSLFLPQYMSYISSGAFLLLGFSCTLCLLPFSSVTFGGAQRPPTSYVVWLIKIIGLECLLVLLFASCMLAYFSFVPTFNFIGLDGELFRQLVEKDLNLVNALFPLGVVLISSIVLAYTYYVEKMGPYPHQATQTLFKNSWEPQRKAFTETSVYASNLLMFTVLLGSGLLLIIASLQMAFGWPSHVVLAPIGYVTLSFMFFLTFLRFYKTRVRVLSRHGLSVSGALIIFSLAAIVLLTLTGWFTQWFIHKSNIDVSNLICKCERFFSVSPISTRLSALYFAFWTLLTPLASSLLVKISEGRSIRSFVFGVILFPSMIIGLSSYYSLHSFNQIESAFVFFTHMSPFFKSVAFFILGMISLLFCLYLTRGQENSDFLHRGALKPMGPSIKGTMRLSEAPKSMAMSKLMFPLSCAIIAVLIFHLVGGWYLLQFQMVVLAPVVLGFIYFSVFVFLHKMILYRAKQ